jgi:hypothetical protein
MKQQGRPLWRCPRCGHTFVTRNLWHSCGNCTLHHHSADKPPFVRELFDLCVAAVRRFTRVVPQVRVRFAGGRPYRIGCQVHLQSRT